MLCEADHADCAGECDSPQLVPSAHPECGGECNIAAEICMYQTVRQVRIEDRMTVCRAIYPRPFGHDHDQAWCLGQCTALADYCTDALTKALNSCIYACCGETDCIDACNSTIVEPSNPLD